MEQVKKPNVEPISIYERLQNVRVAVLEKCTKKTGYNPYSNYYYFDLGDFLPEATRQFKTYGLTPIFNIGVDEDNGMEMATLIIHDWSGNQIRFSCPTAEANVGKSENPIQKLGAKHTYLRRYLFMESLDIVESDIVDSGMGEGMDKAKEDKKKVTPKVEPKPEPKEEKKPEPNVTSEQVDLLLRYDVEGLIDLAKITEHYHVGKVTELPISVGSQIIAKYSKIEKENANERTDSHE